MPTAFFFRLLSVMVAAALVVTGVVFLFMEGSRVQGAVLALLGIFSFLVYRNVRFNNIPDK